MTDPHIIQFPCDSPVERLFIRQLLRKGIHFEAQADLFTDMVTVTIVRDSDVELARKILSWALNPANHIEANGAAV